MLRRESRAGSGDTKPFTAPVLRRVDRWRAERALGIGRLFVAVASIVAVWLDPTWQSDDAAYVSILLASYAAFGASILGLVSWRVGPLRIYPLGIHAADVAFAAFLTLVTEGANSPFFVFCLFAIFGAAYRWGSQRALLTAAAIITLLVMGGAFVWGLFPGVAHAPWLRLLMRATYVSIAGVLVAFLVDRREQRELEAAGAAVIMQHAHVREGLKGTFQATLGTILQLIDAREALLVVRDAALGRAFFWRAQLTQGTCRLSSATDIEPSDEGDYLFDISAAAWHAARRSRDRFAVLGLDQDGNRLASFMTALPLARNHPCRTLLAVSRISGLDWVGRVYLLDPRVGLQAEDTLRLFQTLMSDIEPALDNIYQLTRLRSRAEAHERTRLARELHDGITQSLIGVEMKLDVVRRQAEPAVAEALAGLESILRDEVAGLRELTQEMKIHDATAPTIDDLAFLVERFNRENGINARFAREGPDIALAPHVRREIARILHEGLVNVRKHSGAEHVLVRAGSRDGSWMMSIEDDGRGFPFRGTLALAELERRHEGPVSIKERVRDLGGDLSITSTPDRGTRLEIWIPLSRNHAREEEQP